MHSILHYQNQQNRMLKEIMRQQIAGGKEKESLVITDLLLSSEIRFYVLLISGSFLGSLDFQHFVSTNLAFLTSALKAWGQSASQQKMMGISQGLAWGDRAATTLTRMQQN